MAVDQTLNQNTLPASRAFAVSPNDSTDLTNYTRALYIGGAGAVKVDTTGGDTVTFSAVPVGTVLPICVKRVYNTGTTATLIIGLY